jgi:ubiquinone/menaquinone biosynthesis C-methylase UbiE
MSFTITYRARRIFQAYDGLIQPGQQVLDIGCGNGIVGAMIRDRFQCQVTGTDILDYVKTGLPFKRLADGGELAFGDQSMDVAMLNDMLHHVPSAGQEKLIREALRVAKRVLVYEVKPGAYVSFTDWLPNKIHQPLMRISLSHRSREAWLELFKQLGAQVEVREIVDPPFEGLSRGEAVARFFYKPVVNWGFCLTPGSR